MLRRSIHTAVTFEVVTMCCYNTHCELGLYDRSFVTLPTHRGDPYDHSDESSSTDSDEDYVPNEM